MDILASLLVLAAALGAGAAPVPPAGDTQTVILLHGLGRTPGSMRPMEEALRERGYRVVNLGYPSRERSIPELADSLDAALEACCQGETLHFVTHSLGGILVRTYAELHGADRIGRVVMLSPPNAGSELVDRLERVGPVAWILGPAFMQLGTDSSDVPVALGPPAVDVGIITGDATLNPLFSWWLPGEDDGKVSVESARLEGAEDFLVVPYSHAFIMRREEVILQVAEFLRNGRFLDADDGAPSDSLPAPGLAAAAGPSPTSSHGGRDQG